MQGIFAQAYQASLGRTGDKALKGQKAIEELNKAMEKGQVISAQILPHVARIAREMAAPGLAEARGASFAEQARFSNQISNGWANFREGGGESGLAYFWRMMQQMGIWWEKNGNALGGYFEVLMVDLNTLRVGLKEFFDFAWAGQSNDLTDIFKDNWGIDLLDVRERLLSMFSTFKDLTWRMLEAMGFVKDGSLMQGLSDKFGVFIQNLEKIFTQIKQMMDGISRFIAIWNEAQQGSVLDKVAAVPKLAMAAKDAVSGSLGATYQAGNTQMDLLFGSNSPVVSGTSATRGYDPQSINKLPAFTPEMYTPGMRQTMAQQLTGKVDINLTVQGNSDLAGQLGTPEVQSVIRKATQEGISNMLLGALPSAPIN